MAAPKKNEGSKKGNSQTQGLVGKLAECIMEKICKESEESEDSFEQYAHLLKVRLLSEGQLFQERFVRGYEVLLDTVRVSNQKKN